MGLMNNATDGIEQELDWEELDLQQLAPNGD